MLISSPTQGAKQFINQHMYTTKPLSLFKSHPEAASELPPDGPNAGYLVVKAAADEEDDETTCWGTTTRRVLELPFPQNRVLRVQCGVGDNGSHDEYVVFVPVAGHPLSSNRYHAVVASGKHKGFLMACPREEDMTTCCWCQCIGAVDPRPFDPADVYLQIEFVQHRRGLFTARAVAAADGFPPSIFRLNHWDVYEYKNIDLGEAPGLDAALRLRRLAGDDAIPGTTTTAVGKWYCPFFLIKEHGVSRREQIGRGAVYAVVLEQRWEPVRVDTDSRLASKKVLIGWSIEAKSPEAGSSRSGDAYVRFVAETGERVGVCTTVWERMLWEQNRGGWVDEEEDAGDVADGSVVLVERFVVKRMDGSVVVAFDFVHHNKVTEEQCGA